MQELDGNMIRVREDREDTDTQRSRSNDTFRARPSGPSRGVKVRRCPHSLEGSFIKLQKETNAA